MGEDVITSSLLNLLFSLIYDIIYIESEKRGNRMELEKYLEDNEITVDAFDDAVTIMKILIENGSCVMLSREEHLWVINWIWTETPADRNEVIFLNRANYECDLWEWQKENFEN